MPPSKARQASSEYLEEVGHKTFVYKAVELPSGKTITGKVHAAGENQALAQVRAKGHMVTFLKELPNVSESENDEEVEIFVRLFFIYLTGLVVFGSIFGPFGPYFIHVSFIWLGLAFLLLVFGILMIRGSDNLADVLITLAWGCAWSVYAMRFWSAEPGNSIAVFLYANAVATLIACFAKQLFLYSAGHWNARKLFDNVLLGAVVLVGIVVAFVPLPRVSSHVPSRDTIADSSSHAEAIAVAEGAPPKPIAVPPPVVASESDKRAFRTDLFQACLKSAIGCRGTKETVDPFLNELKFLELQRPTETERPTLEVLRAFADSQVKILKLKELKQASDEMINKSLPTVAKVSPEMRALFDEAVRMQAAGSILVATDFGFSREWEAVIDPAVTFLAVPVARGAQGADFIHDYPGLKRGFESAAEACLQTAADMINNSGAMPAK